MSRTLAQKDLQPRMVKKLVSLPALCKKSLPARNSQRPSHPEKDRARRAWVQDLPVVPRHAARDVRDGPATLLVGARTNVCLRTLQESTETAWLATRVAGGDSKGVRASGVPSCPYAPVTVFPKAVKFFRIYRTWILTA